jgi:hypothetical protein
MKRVIPCLGTALLVLTGCEDAAAPLPPPPPPPPMFSLEGYTEDDIYEMHLNGTLVYYLPSYLGPLHVTPTITDVSSRSVVSYDYVSTTQTGGTTLHYRDGDLTLTSSTSPPLTTGGPALITRNSMYYNSTEIPIVGSPCGKNAFATGWAEIWNELPLIKYVIPRFGYKPDSGSNIKHAPSIYCEPDPPPPGGGGGGGGGDDYCFYCELWEFYDSWGEYYGDEWICVPIDMSYCEALVT